MPRQNAKSLRQMREYRVRQHALSRWTHEYQRTYQAELDRRDGGGGGDDRAGGTRRSLASLTPALVGVRRKLNRVRAGLHLPLYLGTSLADLQKL